MTPRHRFSVVKNLQPFSFSKHLNFICVTGRISFQIMAAVTFALLLHAWDRDDVNFKKSESISRKFDVNKEKKIKKKKVKKSNDGSDNEPRDVSRKSLFTPDLPPKSRRLLTPRFLTSSFFFFFFFFLLLDWCSKTGGAEIDKAHLKLKCRVVQSLLSGVYKKEKIFTFVFSNLKLAEVVVCDETSASRAI